MGGAWVWGLNNGRGLGWVVSGWGMGLLPGVGNGGVAWWWAWLGDGWAWEGAWLLSEWAVTMVGVATQGVWPSWPLPIWGETGGEVVLCVGVVPVRGSGLAVGTTP